MTVQKIIAMILAFINSFLISTGLKKIPVTEHGKETAAVELVNASESDMNATAEYAYNIRNSVQGIYTDPGRNAYRMSNANAVLTHKIKGVNKTASLTDKNGGVYAEDTFRSFYTDRAGVDHFFENSTAKGRVNTIRLGEYYYECHVRDLETASYKVDKAFHVYGDKLHMQYTLFAKKPTDGVKAFGSEITVNADSVVKLIVKDKNGTHSSLKDVDADSVEFAAFDIRGTGVLGFIVPSDGSTEKMTVTKGLNGYKIRQYAAFDPSLGLNDNEGNGGRGLDTVTFGCRVYTDGSHAFDGVLSAAKDERAPLEDIRVESGTSGAQYLGYDALRGVYTLQMNGTDFQTAYDNPEMQFTAPVTVTADRDRVMYFRSYGTSGCLEAAAILDSENNLVPMEVEVCKNFCGDGGEGFYSVKDYAYGDAFFPVTVEKGQTLRFTLIDLYQNWGVSPIKQLSSIEFHTSYYHLSTGTTESNCIAPYFVGDKDGWTLPDFRTRSGNIWAGQPQFNSVGILKFMQHRAYADADSAYGEFEGSVIASSGLAYSDVTNTYVDDDGNFTYSVRHVEMPSTDENRTFYTLDVTFDNDVTYTDFVNNFDLFYFEGRFVKFEKKAYLNEKNVAVAENVDTGDGFRYHVLGSEKPFFGFYKVTQDTDPEIDKGFGCNFALIIRDSSIVMNGEEKQIPFVFREDSYEHITRGALTLNADTLTFRKGDTIKIDMILLPWGTGRETEASTVMKVREDSAIRPLTLTAAKGTAEADAFVPTVKAENGEAEFTVTGGRNNCSVLVKGFTSMLAPVIEEKVNGEWKPFVTASSHGYDGYTVRIAEDGTFSFSFVFFASDPDSARTFRISAGGNQTER